MTTRTPIHVPSAFPPNVEQSTLIRLIRDLEQERAQDARDRAAEAKRYDALEDQLAILRCCRDAACQRCHSCVTALFVKAQPTPLTLPLKYEVPGPWRT